jgi:2-iminobutanoate/2-iminopropanoate deaminase
MEGIATDAAFNSSNPNSQAIKSNGFVFVSGQAALDPEYSGEVVDGDHADDVAGQSIEEQVHLTFQNIETILEEAGCSLDDIVKTTVYFTDPDHYERISEVYAEYVSEPYPARSAIIIADIAVDVDFEIECIAEA